MLDSLKMTLVCWTVLVNVILI